MSPAVKQIVTVRAGGLVEVRSPELHEGDQAQVTVVVVSSANGRRDYVKTGGWRRFAGAANSKDARAGDNDRVDADLAAEYGRHSEAES